MIGKGFAFISPEGDLMIETIGSTVKAVKVNTIAAITQNCVIPKVSWDDAKIEETFLRYGELGQIVPVTIQVHEG